MANVEKSKMHKKGSEDLDRDINGRALFESAVSYRNFSGKSLAHRFKCITTEWFAGRFNITVCDLLFDAAFALKEKDYQKAKQMMDAASHVIKIWKQDELMLGGFMTAKPNEKIKTRHGIITLSKLNKLVGLASKELDKLVESESDNAQIQTLRQNALDAIKNAINEVAPNNSRVQDKQILNS